MSDAKGTSILGSFVKIIQTNDHLSSLKFHL